MAEEGKHDFKFLLGQDVRDKYTGFEGYVNFRGQWLNNCNTYGVKSRKLDKDCKPQEHVVFDEPQLEAVEPKRKEKESRGTGGPCEKVYRTNR